MIDKKILHYKILQKLGEGGMGVVYLAEDTKLKRQVAIKFLPQNISANSDEKKRFEIEAQSAAALNHPNIATVYAIEEYDDQMFIAMEYIDGQELKYIVEAGSESAPAINPITEYAIQIASGLKAAHEKGVVHRDIKSSNIMITENSQVKIMDFGLAKVGTGVQITKEQSTLGTAAYMSPEQTRGEEVDHRSDIWSFGVVLYEMLTGKLPFKGDYEQAVSYAIVNETPEDVTSIRKDVPEYFNQIIQKLLTKNPAERYQNMTEVCMDLEKKDQSHPQISTPSSKIHNTRFFLILGIFVIMLLAAGWYFFTESGISYKNNSDAEMKRIAVLPFTNINKNPESDFLSFALADQIIGSLSYLKNILVRPSSSIRQYQDQLVDIQTAGNDLNVDVVLTGNYLKESKQIRLNVELVDVQTNKIIWREPIEVEYKNTFVLQDIVANKVIDRLKIQFSEDERVRMQSDIPQNPLAYEYYLRSVSYPSTTEGDLIAIEMLKKSIELDSTFAPAYSELGRHRHNNANYGLGGVSENIQAEQDFIKALKLNNVLLDALWNLSLLYTETNRKFEAIELAEKIIEINPNSAFAHFNLGYVFRYVGMLEESEREYDKALALDPENPRFRSAGLTYLSLGKYEKAFKAYNLDQGSSFNLFSYADAMFSLNRREEAIPYLDTLLGQESSGTFYYLSLAMKYIIRGNYSDAFKQIQKYESENPLDPELWFSISRRYGLVGDEESCVRSLDRAIDTGYFNYPYIETDSYFDRVRKGQKFQRVMLKAKKKHEEFKQKYYQNRTKNTTEN